MPWINLTDDELAIVKSGVDREVGFHLVSSHKDETIAAQNLRDRIKEVTTPDPDTDAFYDAATGLDSSHRLSEPDEYENPPFISRSEEGAYVMAWIWVSNEDAGLECHCDECGGTWTPDHMSSDRPDCCRECEMRLDAEDAAADDDASLELQVSGMMHEVDIHSGMPNGNSTLAPRSSVEFWDIQVRKVDFGSGQVDILDEYEDLPTDELVSGILDLLKLKYPNLEAEWVYAC